MAAVNVETGKYETFDQTNTAFEEAPQAAMSSSSIPGVFPPQHFKDMYLMDGGTVWDVNVDSAVRQCLAMGYDQKDIIVDIAICGYSAPVDEPKTSNTIQNWFQNKAVHDYNNGSNAVQEQERAFPDVDYRYYFQDQDDCHVSNYLDFKNSTTWCLQEAGRA